jgi:wobble nucleotide-excising tRNase
MFEKFVIRNVGVLKAFDTPGSPKLAKLSLFYGRNGRGKSTLTSVLRAARDSCSNTVLARQSLGNGGAAPEVTLVTDTEAIRFHNGAWLTNGAPIEVFDTSFIVDNIYAGELTELAHDRGLFSIIIGKGGVKLANHLEHFNVISKETSADLKAAEKALEEDKPSDMGLDEFFALGPNPAYEKRFDDAERALKTVQQAGKIAILKQLEDLPMPILPEGVKSVLDSTNAEIDSSARNQLLEHFQQFSLDKKAEEWIGYGLEHIHDEACPFCGRDDVDEAGMITLYGKIFSDSYKKHLANIKEKAAEVEEALGEDARNSLAGRISTNSELAKVWFGYIGPDNALPDITDVNGLIVEAHKMAKALFESKRSSPLDKIEAADKIVEIEKKIEAAVSQLKSYNKTVVSINAAATKITTTSPITLEDAQKAKNNIQRRIARQDDGVKNRVAEYFRAKKRDERARRVRSHIQAELKKANKTSAEQYHSRVNHYLGRFGASFTISEITNSMQGSSGQVNYGLLIKGETIARGRGKQAEAVPCFRNTLSAGDKTTLAFAFFLAMLDDDNELANKTVVIDDPLSSHDTHRRRETVAAIKDLCNGRCKQMIVLSHDEFLLREVERRCSTSASAAFEIDYSGGDEWSNASNVDLDLLCRAGHVRMIDEIAAYVDSRVGVPDDIVLKIRQILETHYRRSYSGWFDHDQNLGSIVRSISEAGTSHPCHRDLTRLDNCNDATCDKHHGDNAVIILKRGVDPDELKVIASDALELVGFRQPAFSAGNGGINPSVRPLS